MPRNGFSHFVEKVAAADSDAQKELRARVAELEAQLVQLGVRPIGSEGASGGPVMSFLEESGLMQYAKHLQMAGYHDLETMCCMEDHHFKELGLLPGHALKLRRLLLASREPGWQPPALHGYNGSVPSKMPGSYNDVVRAASGGIYKCIHGPRVAIRAAPSPTAAVLDTIHPGTLIRISEVTAGWARVDDDELWARWTSNWPRLPKGVTEDGEDTGADKVVPEKAFILVDGSQVGLKTQLLERLSEDEEQEAQWPFREAMELRCLEVNQAAQRKEPGAAQALRRRFVDAAMRYVGTPYHRSYHDPSNSRYKPGSRLKDAPLFLDHMQLIQKVIEDLKQDFGFLLIANCKPAHCRKTLPVSFEDPEDCEAGDLIFYEELEVDGSPSGRFPHLEIFIGGDSGTESLGSMPWNAHSRTKEMDGVQVFEDFRIAKENGKSFRVHCHSIQTWLLSEETSFAHAQILYTN